MYGIGYTEHGGHHRHPGPACVSRGQGTEVSYQLSVISGRRSEIRGQRSEIRCQRSEVGDQSKGRDFRERSDFRDFRDKRRSEISLRPIGPTARWEIRGRRSEIRSQKSARKNQKIISRDQKTDDRRQRTEDHAKTRGRLNAAVII